MNGAFIFSIDKPLIIKKRGAVRPLCYDENPGAPRS